jgi:carbonic anhydrase
MSKLNEIMSFNERFVASKGFEAYKTDRYPNKQLVVVTCMDTRLTELLPKSMNLANGDAKIIKTAGAIISHPFGSVTRSILVAVYELNASEILVIGHHDCGMANPNPEAILEKARRRGISEVTLATLRHAGVNLHQWLQGFASVQDDVKHSVAMLRNHPLLPKDVPVHGLVIDPVTGRLELIDQG